ncbi:MAG: hypothetical protein ABJ061_21275, partial [Marinobacter sp.]
VSSWRLFSYNPCLHIKPMDPEPFMSAAQTDLSHHTPMMSWRFNAVFKVKIAGSPLKPTL